MSGKYWRDKADKEFSIFIRRRDGKCLFCGSTEYLQCCHLIPSSEIGSRWKKWNAITLCAKHHKFDRIFSFHHNPVRFFKWFEEQHPLMWDTVKELAYGSTELMTYKEVYENLKEVNTAHEYQAKCKRSTN